MVCAVVLACASVIGFESVVSDVERVLHRDGARKALEYVASDPYGRLARLLSAIAAGNARALGIAHDLKPFSDAGVSQEFDLAVGEALKRNPAGVLRILPAFSEEDVCGLPDMDDARFESATNVRRELGRRERALRRVLDPQLRMARDRCLRTMSHALASVTSRMP